MRENEFEKEVRKLMDDFQLSPSASVWEQVRARIVERRRKWPLVALLLLGMLGTGYLIYHQFRAEPAKVVEAKENNTRQRDQGKAGENPVTQEQHPATQQDAGKKEGSQTQKQNASILTLRRSIKNTYTEKSFSPAKTVDSHASQKLNNDDNNNHENDFASRDTLSNNKLQASNNDRPTELKEDSVSANDNTAAVMTPTPAEQQSKPAVVQNNSSPKRNQGKWSIGITAFAGRSNTVENLFGKTKMVSSVNYVNDTLVASTAHPDKPFTASAAYQAGIFVQKEITSKSSLSLGVSYMHYSTKAEVTNSNSSLILAVAGPTGLVYINNYYMPAALGNKIEQVNKYNFIGADLRFHQSLINSKKTPLFADGGFSALRLLSANTLIYDNNTNTYYFKNDWLSNWQASFNTGLSLHININSKNYLFAGPEISYGFTNLLKNKNYAPQHLFSYGLRAGWMIGKK